MRSAKYEMRKTKKRAAVYSALRTPNSAMKSGVRLGLAETGDPVAVFPLAAFLEDFSALKTLEDIALAAQSGRRAETAML